MHTENQANAAPAPKPAGPFVIATGVRIAREGTISGNGYLERHNLFTTAADAWRALDPEHGRRARLFWWSRGYTVRPAQWDERESIRMLDGTYAKLVWENERFWQDRGDATWTHFAHTAQGDRGLVAFTENPEKGARDRQTVMKAGKYLKRFFPELGDRRIAFLAEWQQRGEKPASASLASAELRFATTPEAIVDAYAKGPSSCMHGDDCVSVYGAGDLAIAYLVRPAGASGPEYLARVLCWPERKAMGRIYPNADSWRRDEFDSSDDSEAARDELRRRLRADGFVSFNEQSDVFDGARILCEEHPGGGYVMPYIDTLATSGPFPGGDGKRYWTLSYSGDYRPDRTDGRFYVEPEVWGSCDRCGDDIESEDEVRTVYGSWGRYGADNASSWCEYCCDNYTFRCEVAEVDFDARNMDSVQVRIDRYSAETWALPVAERDAFWCGHAEDWFHRDCESERFPGFPDWLDDDSDAHPELCDDDAEEAAEHEEA